jgi:hypothetical protein
VNDQIEALVERAAAMRAGGASWKAIAAEVGREPDTVEHWPKRYPQQWSRAHRAARRHMLGDSYGESITTLRMLMRSEDERAKLAASTAVAKLQHDQDRLDVLQESRSTPRPGGGKQQELSTDGQRIAGILDGMSFEQMQEMAIRVGQALAAASSGKALKPAEATEGAAQTEPKANPSNPQG